LKMHLTEAVVAKLKANPDRRIEIQDILVSGMRLRISPKGKKSWSYMYKVAGASLEGKRGRNRRITIGEYPLLDLKTARDRCNEAKYDADCGVDPIEEKKLAIAGRNQRRIDLLVDKFIEVYAKPNTKNWPDTKRILETNVVNVWGSAEITSINRAAIHDLLDDISANRGTAYARELRKHLSTMFNWCVDRGVCPFSPMAGMKRRDLQYQSRERFLDLSELNTIWNAGSDMGYPFGPIVQLLILSGQRRSEIANIKRAWISNGCIEIPAAEYKTGNVQVVPLTNRMRAILEGQPIWNGGEFVFSTTNGKTPSSGFSKAKVRVDALTGISNWTFHDIRRSVATHMARAGVIQEHIERVLGHTISGVAGTYNRYSYLDEKRAALETWERTLFGGANN
jgi:integrase